MSTAPSSSESRDPPWRGRPRGSAELWLPLLVGILVFLAVRNVVLNLFYVEGMYFLDAGWFAHMPWRNDWALTSPPGHPAGEVPFLRRHLAFVLIPLNALSYLIDTDHAAFFSLWFAGIFAFGFWTGWLLASDTLRRAGVGRPWSPLLASAFGALFALNGVSLSTLLYPHPEVLMAFAIAGLLWSVERDRPGLAWLFGVIALSTRTDGGFHVAIFATVGFLCTLPGRCGRPGVDTTPVSADPVSSTGRSSRRWLRDRLADPRARRYLLLGAFAFAYSAIGYAVQSRFVPATGTGQFTDIYAGTGFFSHVSPGLLTARLKGYLDERLYAFAGFGACLLGYALTRRSALLFGMLAGLPWLAIHLVAVSQAAGGLFSYYAFPFVVLLAWPLVSPGATDASAARRLFAAALVGVLASVSLALGPGAQGRVVKLAALRASTPEMQHLRTALSTLIGQIPSDELRLDGAATSLAAREVRPTNLFLPDRDQTGVVSVIFFARYMDAGAIRETFGARGLGIECALPRSPLRLLTSSAAHRALAQAAGFVCP